MRLAKYLATAGIASRRAAEELIRARRVVVNGQTVVDPALDVGESDAITCDGEPVQPPAARERVVYAVNKPIGVVSTARDTHGRPTVVQLVKAGTRLYPVGRLDADTTGLILLTDDGDLAHRLTHPSFEVEKTYRATVARPPVRDAAIEKLRAGIALEEGTTAPARVRRIDARTLELTIHEGRKRQVRRMCEAVGHRVVALERTRFGPLELGALKPGHHRQLTQAEIAALRDAPKSAGRAGRRGAATSS